MSNCSKSFLACFHLPSYIFAVLFSNSMVRRLIALHIILLVVARYAGISQRFGRDFDRQNAHLLYEDSRSVYVEALNFPSEDSSKSRLDINFRIAFNFFVFVSSSSPSSQSPFVAKGEITVEVLDSTNTSVARELVTKELYAEKPPDQNVETQAVEGIFSFDLLPGTYTIVAEVKDRESERHYFDKGRKILLKDFRKAGLGLSDIIFLREPVTTGNYPSAVRPLNLGGNVPFGEDCGVYAEVISTGPKESLLVELALSRVGQEYGSGKQILIDTIPVNELLVAKTLSPVRNEESYEYRLVNSSCRNKYTVVVQLHSDTLELGNYNIAMSVRTHDAIDSVEKRFHLRWSNMPRSLHNLDLAVEALEYIMTKNEFSDLKNSASEKRRQLFEEFWKKRDPTPKTAYNEAMAEYYRRVDHVGTAFATVHQNDGVRTDRGKAYLLYGPPTRTERSLLPNEPPIEIWYYETLVKKLTFIDEHRSGDYRLSAEEQLNPGK